MVNSVEKISTNDDYEIREQDRFLPIANVSRVMKKALPPHGKLSKEAKICVQECVSEFISFVSSQAADKVNIEKRKTLTGEDVLWSLLVLGFENYAELLRIYLAKYRQCEQQGNTRNNLKKLRKKEPEYFKEEDYNFEDFEESAYNSNSGQEYGSERYNAESVDFEEGFYSENES